MAKMKIILSCFFFVTLNVFTSEDSEADEEQISKLLDKPGWMVKLDGVKQVKITDEMVRGFTAEELLKEKKLKKDTKAKSNREEESNCCWKLWN